MTKVEVLDFIATSHDLTALDEIQGAAYKRKRAVGAAQFQAKVDEWWAHTRFWKEGDTLYCAATGTFLGGPLQRGDKGTIYAVQPRKRMLWLTIRKQTIRLPASEVYRYRLQPNPPDKPISALDRAMANVAASAMR